MTAPSSTAPIRIVDDGYQPGVCNIGTWEIRRRRAGAFVAFVIGLGAFGLMVAGGVPAPVRLLLVFPFWGGAFSWLQARRRFCAAFAMGGVSNFGDNPAARMRVADPAAHHQDLLAVLRMTRDSFVVGLALALVAVLLPV
jgi:hypothetical protein